MESDTDVTSITVPHINKVKFNMPIKLVRGIHM